MGLQRVRHDFCSHLIARPSTEWASQEAPVGKNPPASAGDAQDAGPISGSGRSPGLGNGNPLQYSCLENSIDREAWWATVRGITKSQTQLRK